MNMLLYMLILYIIYCCSPYWQLAELRPWLDHVGFVVHKVAVGQVYLQVLWFVIPPMLHVHSSVCYKQYIILAFNSTFK